VREKGELVQDVRIREISQVSVLGNVMLTAGAVQAMCAAERPQRLRLVEFDEGQQVSTFDFTVALHSRSI
jgi:hypothetical protein